MFVEEQRKILVITDGDPKIQNIAEKIALNIRNPPFAGCLVTVKDAVNFTGTDLLPASVFFIGCQEPKSSMFFYIKDLFDHINLAGRPCGIFSTNTKTLKYLFKMVRPCEASAGKPLLAKNGEADSDVLNKWIHSIIKSGGWNE